MTKFTAALLLALCACAGAQPKISTLTKRLDSDNPQTRIKAADQLSERGGDAVPALPKLLVLFRDNHRPAYEAAGRAIRATGDEGVLALAAALSDRDAWVRCRAAENLGLMGPAASKAVPQLINALRDKDFCVQEKAAQSLGAVGEAALGPLVTAVKEENVAGRRGAADAIAKLDPALQRRAVDELKQGYKSRDELKRGEVFERLAALGKAAAPVLLEGLWDPDVDIRHRSLDALEEIEDYSPGMVEALAGLFKDPQRTVRLRAAVLLGKFGQKEPSVLPKLTALLSATDVDTRRGALEAIGNVGVAAAGATDTLVALMENDQDPLKNDAVEALIKIGTTEALRAAERHTRRAYPKHQEE